MAYSDNLYTLETPAPLDRAEAEHAHTEHTRGYSGERVVLWLLLIAALGFWLPYTFMVDHGIFTALS